MALSSETNRKETRGEVAGRRRRGLARAARLGVAAAAVLIFAVHPLQAQTETVLHSFAGPINGGTGADGAAPLAGLVRDSSGNFYGTTDDGGTFGIGTVFEVVNSSGSYTEKVLYSFTGPINGGTAADGALPNAGLIMDSSGNLYGTTYGGGTSGVGTVFEMVYSSGSYTEKVLYSFKGVNAGDGSGPLAGLVMDSSGNLYGTTFRGGSSIGAGGTVFELVNSSGSYTEEVLHSFPYPGAGGDGSVPEAGLIMDSSGNLYGATTGGGTFTAGTVFELPCSGSPCTYPAESVLYSLTATGGGPAGGVIMDTTGNFYGTGGGGGTYSLGTVFELVNSSGSYTEKVLYSFAGPAIGGPGADGAYPNGDLVMDSSGNLYGTTSQGGTAFSGTTQGDGTVFELVNSSGSYTERLLHSFAGLGSGDGSAPNAGLVMDPSGNLYGTTGTGGASGGYGTVFEVTSASAPAVTLSATSLNFGNVPVGTPSGAMSVTVTNTGSANLIFASGAVTLSGMNAADFTILSDGCSGTTVLPNKTCSVSVTFTPSATGAASAALTFTDNATPTTQVVNLSGTGVLPTITVGPSTLANGTSGTPYPAVTFTATGGTGTVTFAVTAGAPPPGLTLTSAGVLSGTPTQTGAFPFTVTATDSIGDSGSVSVSLTVGPKAVATTTTIASTSTTFDGYSLPTNVALVNTTPVAVKFTVQPASGGSPATGAVTVKDGFSPADSCSGTLTAGAGSCALTISQLGSGSTPLTATYTPDANSSGLLSSTSSPVTESIVEIVAPCNAVAGPPSAPAGSTILASFVVCLAGNVNAVPTAVTTNCLTNATCTITVTPIPGQPGAYTVTLSIVTSAGSIPLQGPQPRSGPWPLAVFGLGMLLAMLMALQLARHREGRLRLAYSTGLVLALVLAGFSGCSGSKPNQNATPAGAYTINVTVTAGNFSVKVPVNVTVTK
jgi:uncharacterized repeat protein (TIGR03803 family)